MAKPTKPVTKINDGDALRLLHVGRLTLERGHGSYRHAHPHWQLELIEAGRVVVVLDDAEHTLGPDHLLLLPPGAAHRFIYRRTTRLMSFKFEGALATAEPVSIVAAGEQAAALTRAAAALCLPGAARAEVNAALRSVVLQCARLCLAAPGDTEPTLAQRVAQHVRQHCRGPLTVTELAAALGYTPGHVSAVYREAFGEPLKRFIDRCRAELAARDLRFSDGDVTTIAQQLGFNDVYTFSRFVKRTTGRPPSAHRGERACGGGSGPAAG